jgi:hypothetical protein
MVGSRNGCRKDDYKFQECSWGSINGLTYTVLYHSRIMILIELIAYFRIAPKEDFECSQPSGKTNVVMD